MGEILPDGTIQGYQGYCPKCRKVIDTNIQGNEIGTHNCSMTPDKELEEAAKEINRLIWILEGIYKEAKRQYAIARFGNDEEIVENLVTETWERFKKENAIKAWQASQNTQKEVSEEEIEKAVKELSKLSTAPDRETPDWMEADIRRGINWALNRTQPQNKIDEQPQEGEL